MPLGNFKSKTSNKNPHHNQCGGGKWMIFSSMPFGGYVSIRALLTKGDNPHAGGNKGSVSQIKK
jgi:hypothetical protein